MINAETMIAIDEELTSAIKRNKKLQRLYQRVRDGTANFEDCQKFAIEIGEELSAAFGQYIVPTELPNGRMTFAIADEVVKPNLIKGYDYTSSYFNEVQDAYYKAKKLNIKGAKPDLLESRLDGFIEKLTSDEYQAVSWILEDPAYIVNYLEAVVDTGIKNNVGMLGQSGIRAKITREVDGGACPWCMNLAGTYDYPVDDEVYRRHRDCHCKVTYEVSDGFRQDVWSKRTWQVDDAVERRKQFEVTKTMLSPKRAKELENILLNN